MSVYLICYAASFLFSRAGYYMLSGLVLMMAAVYLYWRDCQHSKNLIHLRSLFSLFWVGGQGISCLKLSRLQPDWSLMTWVCLMLAYVGFWITFECLSRIQGGTEAFYMRWHRLRGYEKSLYHSIVGVTVVSVAAFLFEAVTLGFIPLFTIGVPHAYSTFHITGVHYLTVSCVLVPALSVLYFYVERGKNGKRSGTVLFMVIVACVIPVLCVSRFQLILAIGMALFTYIAIQGRIHILYVIGVSVVLLFFYVILTIARGHDVTYLNGIFEMKNSRMPIFITQPYMYIANNYDNFNCLTEKLPAYTLGLRMLFPVWALTGLKFLFPALVSFPLYVTKEELTTVTLFYDAFYDFGMVGVLLFSCLLGAVCYYLVKNIRSLRNPVGFLFYAQIGLYLVFSFFTTWFSNPATWFYLILTGGIYLYCEWKG